MTTGNLALFYEMPVTIMFVINVLLLLASYKSYNREVLNFLSVD